MHWQCGSNEHKACMSMSCNCSCLLITSLYPCRLHGGVRRFLPRASARGRRRHGAYPGVRERIGVGEAPVRPLHLPLERLRRQSRRALPRLQSAQVRGTEPHTVSSFYQEKNRLKFRCRSSSSETSRWLWTCASAAANIVSIVLCCFTCRFPKDTQPGLVRQEVGSKKLIALGLQITPMEKIIRDAVESLKSRGHIS